MKSIKNNKPGGAVSTDGCVVGLGVVVLLPVLFTKTVVLAAPASTDGLVVVLPDVVEAAVVAFFTVGESASAATVEFFVPSGVVVLSTLVLFCVVESDVWLAFVLFFCELITAVVVFGVTVSKVFGVASVEKLNSIKNFKHIYISLTIYST